MENPRCYLSREHTEEFHCLHKGKHVMNRLDNTATLNCQQQKLIENKKPNKRTGYMNMVPNSWEVDFPLDHGDEKILKEIYQKAPTFNPSQEGWAKICKMSKKTFGRKTKHLETIGHLEIERGKKGWKGTNKYKIPKRYLEEALWGKPTAGMGVPMSLSLGTPGPLLITTNLEKPTIIHDGEAVIELPEKIGVNPDIKKKNSSHFSREKRKSRAKAKINYKGLLKTEVGHSMDMSEIVWGGAGSYDWIKANRAMLSMITKHGMAARQWIDDFVGSGKITWRDIKSRSIDQFIYDMDCELNKLAKM